MVYYRGGSGQQVFKGPLPEAQNLRHRTCLGDFRVIQIVLKGSYPGITIGKFYVQGQGRNIIKMEVIMSVNQSWKYEMIWQVKLQDPMRRPWDNTSLVYKERATG